MLFGMARCRRLRASRTLFWFALHAHTALGARAGVRARGVAVTRVRGARASMADAFLPAPVVPPAEPLLASMDDWLAEGAAPPKTVGVQAAYVVHLGTKVIVPPGLVLESADVPFDQGLAGAEHEIVAGAGETAELQLRIGRAYSLRFRDAEGRVGPATLASAIADPDLCAWWLCAVPRSVGHAAVQAAVSLVRALAAGERRLRCDVLLPGLNPRIETACGLDDRLLQLLSFELARCLASAGRSVMLLFDSAGTAASAQAAWVQLYAVPPPASVVFRGLANKPVTRDEARGLNWDFSPAVTPNEPRDAYVVVRPRNSRGDAVVLALMQAHAKMPDATWLLINPELEDTALRGTFGIRETDRYMSFLGSFEQCYLARGMYLVKRPRMTVSERGHLGMRYGESWDALKRNANGFSPIERFARRPTPNEIDAVGW